MCAACRISLTWRQNWALPWFLIISPFI
ncbi:MAG: hypothetical protein J7623_23400 [Chitinophaga sp.]|nr:hypothetical protein [Chitinophaga sp.]